MSNATNTNSTVAVPEEDGSGDITTTLAGDEEGGMNMALIGGIIGAVVVVIVIAIVVMKGKGKAAAAGGKDADAKADKHEASAQEDDVV